MLKDKIAKDTITALKAGQKDKLAVLRYLSSQIQNAEIEIGKKQLSDETLVKLISNQIKKLKESLELFTKGERQDLIDKTKFEIEVLTTYLPQQLSDTQLEAEIKKIISANKTDNLGMLIGIGVKVLSGKADNGRIAGMVKKLTGKKTPK
jgi:hypothetical protein